MKNQTMKQNQENIVVASNKLVTEEKLSSRKAARVRLTLSSEGINLPTRPQVGLWKLGICEAKKQSEEIKTI